MADWMEEMGLEHFGFSDDQIAKINAAIPKAAFIAGLVKQYRTTINELFDVAEMVLDQMDKFQKGQS